MNPAVARHTVKTVAGAIAVPVIGILLYLGAVFSVYLLAWVLGLIGLIFR